MKDQGFFNTELKTRIISAVILAILVAWVTWVGDYSFSIFLAVLGLFVFFEFTRMVEKNLSVIYRIIGFIMLLIFLAVWFSGDKNTAFIVAAVSVSTLATWEGVARRSLWVALGFAYAVLPFVAMVELRGETNIGLITIALVFACVWGADIFAYVFGRLIGGPKLAPQISPNKTWAGFVGSLIGAIALCSLVIFISNQNTNTELWWLILIVALVSQIGDLAISFIKRRFVIKDTGKIIPGHGGVLDRVDGLLPASVAFWLILKFRSSDVHNIQDLGATLFLF